MSPSPFHSSSWARRTRIRNLISNHCRLALRISESLALPHLFGVPVGALKQPRVGEDEELEGVLYPAQVAHVDHRQAVQFVQVRELEPGI